MCVRERERERECVSAIFVQLHARHLMAARRQTTKKKVKTNGKNKIKGKAIEKDRGREKYEL